MFRSEERVDRDAPQIAVFFVYGLASVSPCKQIHRGKRTKPAAGPASLRPPVPAPLGALPPLLLLLLLTVASRRHPHRGRQAYRCLAA
jgi:hypothetical protein